MGRKKKILASIRSCEMGGRLLLKAIVNVPVCPLMTRPGPDCERADEVLLGMVVEVLEQTTAAYWRLRAPYRYEGYAPCHCLLTQSVAAWEQKPKKVVRCKGFADVQQSPSFQSWPLVTAPMGAILAVAEEKGTARPGWMAVELPSTCRGWVRESWLDDLRATPPDISEADLRARLVAAALAYQGAPYRWGGKTPMGIDCSGLVSMAYLLNGITICRDARLEPGFDLVDIPREEIEPGDVLFFPGHVALYLGEGRYVHATGKAGSDGVVTNSLDPAADDYRPDLAGSVTAIGSYRGFHPCRDIGR